MMKVYVAPNSMLAHHIKGLLNAAGISATVRGEGLSTMQGVTAFDMSTQPAVWVIQNDDAKRAVEIVRDYEQSGDHDTVTDAPAWQCSGCSETIEGQFTVCWRCSVERPSGQ
jgi:hypothetical protein